MNFLSDLNPQQLNAVKIIDKPLLIVAGPGTGKTRTLIAKVKYLIKQKNFDPKEILTLTFTRKAANEIHERLGDKLLVEVQTFHSLAYKLIAKQGEKINIISDKERNNIIRDCLKQKEVSETSLLISNYKNKIPGEVKNAELEKLVAIYNSQLEKLKLKDYDDLQLQAYELLKNKNESEKYKYILVDEFQDTNSLQYEILKLLLGKNKNIFAIGDPLQSIYGFRGADSDVFEKFKNDFPGCEEINLKINYRSDEKIISTSHLLFPETTKLQSAEKIPGTVKIIQTENEYSEADFVISEIGKLIGGTDLNNVQDSSQLRFSDFAVLFRLHSVGKILEKRFQESGLPFQLVGGRSLYQLPKIEKIINSLKKIKNDFKDVENTVTSIFDEEKLSDVDVVEFKNILYSFKSENWLEDFFKYLDEISENEFYDYKVDKVSLMTIHSAKGLEFKHVFVVGFEQGIIPHIPKNKSRQTDLEEEKRLLYVAMTRAKQGLYLLTSNYRFKQRNKISQFYEQLKPEIKIEQDERIEKIHHRREVNKQKKAQMKMF